ncbi:hypothetical protein [Parabacteroides sp. PF5-6]|uniref:hypothetical protein n=1 Tax=Parabacteroides sp. PF5-6 TaxID=1742403 RepID=UPI0024075A58|nr:hypothetical protein [Parabacteroides sp. PF5-6]MDF9830972.1 hypothetical protein [Parabacteroides sp. PF5-6]
MKRTISHRTLIRFRRWSRKGYAVFSSLGRCVTIGALKKGLADASLKKQQSPVQTLLLRLTTDGDEEAKEAEEKTSEILFQFYRLLIQPQVAEEVCSVQSTELIISENRLAG